MARRIIDVNAIADDTFLDTEKLVITHRINSYLRSNPPLEDINATHYALVNIFSQLMMEALEQTGERSRKATISFPFGLKNADQAYLRKSQEAIVHAPHVPIFIGMMGYALAYDHDLINDDASDGSSLEPKPYGSEHPSRECNMAHLMVAPIAEEATTHTPPDKLTAKHHEAHAWERVEHLKV